MTERPLGCGQRSRTKKHGLMAVRDARIAVLSRPAARLGDRPLTIRPDVQASEQRTACNGVGGQSATHCSPYAASKQ